MDRLVHVNRGLYRVFCPLLAVSDIAICESRVDIGQPVEMRQRVHLAECEGPGSREDSQEKRVEKKLLMPWHFPFRVADSAVQDSRHIWRPHR
jgi:hypothetical protein